MSYTITDASGSEKVESMGDLFDGLIMRGVSAEEAVYMTGGLVVQSVGGPKPPPFRTSAEEVPRDSRD